MQSLAKVFEVVAGIQVGSRRNSRGRIPPCLTRKYFSGRLGVFARVARNKSRRRSSNRVPVPSRVQPVLKSAAALLRRTVRLRSRFQIILNIVIDWRHVCTILYAYVKGGGGRGEWNKTYATLILSEGSINDDFNQPVITIKYINVRRINSTRMGEGEGGIRSLTRLLCGQLCAHSNLIVCIIYLAS